MPCCNHSRENRWFDGGLDDSGINGQDREDDAGQKHQSQLVDVLYANKHYGGHGGQQDGPVHTHVVQQSSLRLRTL